MLSSVEIWFQIQEILYPLPSIKFIWASSTYTASIYIKHFYSPFPYDLHTISNDTNYFHSRMLQYWFFEGPPGRWNFCLISNEHKTSRQTLCLSPLTQIHSVLIRQIQVQNQTQTIVLNQKSDHTYVKK